MNHPMVHWCYHHLHRVWWRRFVDMDCCVSVLAENCYAPNGDFTVRHLQFINHGEYVSCIADEVKRCRSIRLSPCISEAADSHVNMPGYCLLD